MRSYQGLLRDVLKNGEVESQRALVKGEQVSTRVLYHQNLTFNLGNGKFPMVTIKKTYFKIVKEELKWFIRGENNVKSLRNRGITIWDEWADSEGDLGGSYPGCWRSFGGKKDQLRQLEYLFRLHAKVGPSDSLVRKWKRRLLLTSWDPNIEDNRGPVGCHTLAQWHITMGTPAIPETSIAAAIPATSGELHCSVYMRSVDLFLGLPYNIASYALLTNLFAHIGGLKTGKLHMCLANAHIYNNHEDQVVKVIENQPYAPPLVDTTFFTKGSQEEESNRDNWSVLEGDWDSRLLGYQSHESIRGDIAV